MGCALVVLIALSLKFKLTNRGCKSYICMLVWSVCTHASRFMCVFDEEVSLLNSRAVLWLSGSWECGRTDQVYDELSSTDHWLLSFFPLKLLTQYCSSVRHPVNRLLGISYFAHKMTFLQGGKLPFERHNSHQPNTGVLCLKHRNVFVPHLWVIYDVIQRMAAEVRVLFSPYCELIIFAVAVNELPRKQLCVFGTTGTKSLSHSR